ncbi:MAG TPA: peptidase C1 [Candidatus Sumerlaeia bacterium]|nr:MAG: Papain family cysteine protease [candidate division BRC1 bacterium ADurb.Bin183]HRR30527.1 peptidase C1 [Candidatus Sumerlaeia bacterium]
MKKFYFCRFLLFFFWGIFLFPLGAAEKDSAVYIEKKPGFQDMLKARAAAQEEKPQVIKKDFKMDFSNLDIPTTADLFVQVWHQPSFSQDLTGACWSFSATSFFESEIYRLSGRQIRLSAMHTVYWEFVEKARRFVRERGDSDFVRGSQPNAILHIFAEYGALPYEAYNGMKSGSDIFNDIKMFSEMKAYLESVKAAGAWNEEAVIATVRAIMNSHMGAPPEKVLANGAEMTPQEYFKNVLGLKLEDYWNFISLMEFPFYEKVEYPVSDNWWHCRDYINLPLDVFMKIIKKAAREGYSVCMAGDNSEPGFFPPLNAAVVPSFDIPADYIDDAARQMRFNSESTTDDHAIHLVGYLEKNGNDWYLIKDSGNRARDGRAPGYFFYREDFVKLKMMNIMAHKDVAKEFIIQP